MNEKLIGIMPSVPESKSEMELFREKIAEILKDTTGEVIGLVWGDEFSHEAPFIVGEFSQDLGKVVSQEDIDRLLEMNEEDDCAIPAEFDFQHGNLVEITDRTFFEVPTSMTNTGNELCHTHDLFIGRTKIGETKVVATKEPFEFSEETCTILGTQTCFSLMHNISKFPNITDIFDLLGTPLLDSLNIRGEFREKVSKIDQ